MQATHYTLVRFTRETQVADDGRHWYEDDANGGEEYVTLEEAVSAARRHLDLRGKDEIAMWQNHVGVLAHAVEDDGEPTGWAHGWVTADGWTAMDGFVEGDYENDERLWGPREPVTVDTPGLTPEEFMALPDEDDDADDDAQVAGSSEGEVFVDEPNMQWEYIPGEDYLACEKCGDILHEGEPCEGRSYLDVRFDVTDLTSEERSALAIEVVVQAERSDGHPSVEVEVDWNEVEHDEPSRNEICADRGANISACTADWGQNDLHTDIADALANVIHFCHRAGIDPDGVWAKADWSADGDLEDGPEAKFNPTLVDHPNVLGEA